MKCPACGHVHRDPAVIRAEKKREGTPKRKAYQRDYRRGMAHRVAGKPKEDNPSGAYLTGYGETDR